MTAEMEKSDLTIPSPTESFDDTVAEIRSSLLRATSVVPSDVGGNHSDHSSDGKTEPGAFEEVRGLTKTKTPPPQNPPADLTPRLECGRLKYSHVKGEWILRHVPIHLKQTNKEGGSNHEVSSKTVVPLEVNSRRIATIVPTTTTAMSAAGSAGSIADIAHASGWNPNASSETKPPASPRTRGSRRVKRNRSVLKGESETQSNHQSGDSELETEGMMDEAPESQPPLQLVQCLLRGSEFIAMMEQVRSAALDRHSGDAVCWSRFHHGPISLQTLLMAMSKDEDSMTTIEMCIQSAQEYTTTLASEISNGNWEVRLAEELMPTEMAIRLSEKNYCSKRRKLASMKAESRGIIDEPQSLQTCGELRAVDFVKACLSVPCDETEMDGENLGDLIRKSNIFGNRGRRKTNIQTPVTKRPKWYRSGFSDSLHSATPIEITGPPLKECFNSPSSRNNAVSMTSKCISQHKMRRQSEVVEKEPSKGSLSALSEAHNFNLEERRGPKSPLSMDLLARNELASSSLMEMFDKRTNAVTDERQKSSSSHKATPASNLGSPRRSQKKRSFRWNDEWKSPLMGLGELKRNSIFRASETNHDGEILCFSLASNESLEAKSASASQILAEDNNDTASSRVSLKSEVGAPSRSRGNYCDKNDSTKTSAYADNVNESMSLKSKSPSDETQRMEQCKLSTTSSSLSGPGAPVAVGKKIFEPMTTRQRSRIAHPEQGSIVEGRQSGAGSSALSTSDSQLADDKVNINSRYSVDHMSRSNGMNVRGNNQNPRQRRRVVKKSIVGHWYPWERYEFLRLMKVHGRGKWKLISESLPLRNSVQVKTHAQGLMKKVDKGHDIFKGLDEYLNNPAAFGKPPDDDPIWDESSQYQEVLDVVTQPFRMKKYTPPPVVRNRWVHLSHKGQVSDYHGFSRKYEHFYPLKGKSLSEVQEEITTTIVHRSPEVEDDADEEIQEEEEAFLIATQAVEKRAKKERRRKETKSTVGDVWMSRSLDLPVMFSKTNEHVDGDACKGYECKVCETRSKFEVDEFSLNAPATFKYFDKEDEDVIDEGIDDDEEGKGRRRKSRTAQIAVQKKASLMVMQEMLNTLHFIHGYNSGFKKATEDSLGTVDEATQKFVEKDEGGESRSTLQKRRAIRVCQSADGPREESNVMEKFEPVFEPLTHLHLMDNYAEIKAKNRFFYALNVSSTITDATQEIGALLNKPSADVEAFLADEDIALEEKALTRGIRTYSRKADQEKLEKKEFAEKQEQLLRKKEYSTANRKRKESPELMEWKMVDSRTLCFAASRRRLEKKHEPCPFGASCLICAPLLHSELPYEQRKIFNPSFRRVDNEEAFIREREAQDFENESGRRIKRTGQRDSQRTASKLKLSELSHTFEFITKYNNGMIQEIKR